MTFYNTLINQITFHFIYMTIFYVLCIIKSNGSMVDFGWPSGFFLMSIFYFFTGTASILKRLIICLPLFIAGLRFMLGWLLGRKHHIKEDRRWELWRERWRKGEGWLGIKSVPMNFFFFYHAQSMTNALIFSLPLILITNSSKEVTLYEVFGLILWIISFILENISDFQLKNFKLKRRNKENPCKATVCRDGFWAYSRHPNYFFEFICWIAVFIMTYPNITETIHYVFWIGIPFAGYFFLVEFTGVPMCELQSLKTRGEDYRKYQEEVSMFVPWIPKCVK